MNSNKCTVKLREFCTWKINKLCSFLADVTETILHDYPQMSFEHTNDVMHCHIEFSVRENAESNSIAKIKLHISQSGTVSFTISLDDDCHINEQSMRAAFDNMATICLIYEFLCDNYLIETQRL